MIPPSQYSKNLSALHFVAIVIAFAVAPGAPR
jgi:hypothetical protein